MTIEAPSEADDSVDGGGGRSRLARFNAAWRTAAMRATAMTSDDASGVLGSLVGGSADKARAPGDILPEATARGTAVASAEDTEFSNARCSAALRALLPSGVVVTGLADDAAAVPAWAGSGRLVTT